MGTAAAPGGRGSSRSSSGQKAAEESQHVVARKRHRVAMLKELFKPSFANAAGWVAAGAVVYGWQCYENSKSLAVEDPKAFNKSILESQKEKKK